MNRKYEVTFATDALPGVFAVGAIRRGQSAQVEAAEAVRLVDVKGLAFASAADAQAARSELAAPEVNHTDLSASADPVTAATEEH